MRIAGIAFSQDNEADVIPSVTIIVIEEVSYGSDGRDPAVRTAIRFCPFCAEKIECIEKELYQVVHDKYTVLKPFLVDTPRVEKVA